MAHVYPNETAKEAEFFFDRFHLCERSGLKYRAFMTWQAYW